jgi:hypothetical protein
MWLKAQWCRAELGSGGRSGTVVYYRQQSTGSSPLAEVQRHTVAACCCMCWKQLHGAQEPPGCDGCGPAPLQCTCMHCTLAASSPLPGLLPLRRQLFDDPNMDIDDNIKRLRQANFRTSKRSDSRGGTRDGQEEA